jgi:hypothetical protein
MPDTVCGRRFLIKAAGISFIIIAIVNDDGNDRPPRINLDL